MKDIIDAMDLEDSNAVGQVLQFPDSKDDPDRAARAMQIGEDLGVPAPVVLGNFDDMERQHKNTLATAFLSENNGIRSYVMANPMAAKVSADDWGNLDKVAVAAGPLSPLFGTKAGRSILQAGLKAFGEELSKESAFFPDLRKDFPNDPARQAVLAWWNQTPLGGIDQLFKGIGALNRGLAAGTAQAALQAGEDPGMARRLERDLNIFAQVALPELAGTAGLPGKFAFMREQMHQAYRKAEPWIKEGQPLPIGVLQEADVMAIRQADLDIKNFTDLVAESDRSTTKQRSPALFELFARQHFGDEEIGISREGLEKAGSKLDFIEDLEQQAKIAEQTGTDVKVPIAKFLANVDKDTVKELEPFLRLREEGVTIKETEALQQRFSEEPKAAVEPIDPAVEGVRKQAGINNDFVSGWDRVDGLQTKAEGREGEWVPISQQAKVFIPKEFTATEQALFKLVDDELNRIVPKAVEHAPTIEVGAGTRTARGVYTQYKDYLPTIFYALTVDDPIQVARHEAIHHLRGYGFFSDAEWATLERAAKEENWLGKDREGIGSVEKRYASLDEGKRLEEAIADEFSYWKRNPDSPTIAASVFQKLRDFLNRIYEKIMELATNDPEVISIFKMIESGEIGSREPKPRLPEAFSKFAEKAQGELDVTRQGDKPVFKAGGGFTTATNMKKYLDLLREQREEDAAYMRKQGERLERLKQTEEWHENYNEVKAETETKLGSQPDIEAMRYFRYREASGKDLGYQPHMDERQLTKEQQKMLPESWYRRDGEDINDIAPVFGFKSGQDMVDALIALEADRAGMQPARWWERKVTAETDKTMSERYGHLEQNILDAAQEHVFGDTQLDILHEETFGYAAKAGVTDGILNDKGIPFTKKDFQEGVKADFAQRRMEGMKVNDFINAAGRAGRTFEDNVVKGNWKDAFKAKQEQYINSLYAKEMKTLEREQKQFNKLAKRYDTRATEKRTEQEYTYIIQDLLDQAGVGFRKITREDINRGLESTGETLDSYVTRANSFGEDIAAPIGYRPELLEKMTVEQFRDLNEIVRDLDRTGRAEKQITMARGKEALDRVIDDIVQHITQRPKVKEGRSNPFYHVDAGLTRLEELAKDFDLREELGPFWDAVIRPAVLSKEKAFDMTTALGNHMKENRKRFDADWRKSLEESIPQDFMFDLSFKERNTPFALTRENMLMMMLNWGNRENRAKLVKGIALSDTMGGNYRGSPEHLAEVEGKIGMLFEQHAKRTDWEYAQFIWDIFEGYRKEIDTLSRNVAGKIPKWVEADAIETPHGTFAGGWVPLERDQTRVGPGMSQIQPEQTNGPLGPNYFRATTPQRHLRERTGASYWVDISSSIDKLGMRMQQQIHDIAYRDFVINASKIIYDGRVKAAVSNYYGPEYSRQLAPWLERVANQFTQDEPGMQAANNYMRMLRMNLTASALPLNYAVMLSPSPGTANPLVWSSFERHRSANMALVMEKSHELKHLIYNIDRDISDKMAQITEGSKWSQAQIKGMEIMFKGLTMMEQELRGATFFGEYHAQLAKGRTEGEASLLADSIVRERHGAMSMVDLPAWFAPKSEAWKALTMFGGYFSTMQNWMRQIPGAARNADPATIAKIVWGTILIPAAFNAALFTKTTEKESWTSMIARSLFAPIFQANPISRVGWNFASENNRQRTPWFGLIEQAFRTLADGYHTTTRAKHYHNIRNAAALAGAGIGIPGALQIGRTSEFISDVARDVQRPQGFIEWMRGLATGEAKLKKK